MGLLLVGFSTVASAVGQAKDFYDEAVLRQLNLRFKQTDWQLQLAQNYASKTYIRADLSVDGVTYRDVGVRYRGNSSYKAVSGPKKPFKISMDEFVSGQELLGYNTINLNNGYRDPSFVREVLLFRMFRRWMPASKANFVTVAINSANYGVYINVEQPNKDLLRSWFEDPSGLRYRAERSGFGSNDDPAFRWLGTNPANYHRAYQLKTENPVSPWLNLVETCRVLNQTAAANMHTEIPKIFDVDNAIRYLAGNNLAPAMDSYIGNAAHNFYIYEDPWHRRTAMLPWDHNAAFGGNSWLTVVQKQQLDPFYFTSKVYRPLLYRVIVEPQWRQRYLAHMRSMMRDYYNWAYAGPLATGYQALIGNAVRSDPIRLYPFSQFAANLTQDLQVRIGSRNQWIPGIKPMIEKRRAYLLNRADFRTVPPQLSGLRHTPARPRDQDAVTVTVHATSSVGLHEVRLFWRRRGAYLPTPMFDDGRHGDGAANDGVFGLVLPRQGLGAQVDYYVAARSTLANGGAMAFAPANASHQPPQYRIRELSQPGALVLNEVLADNETVDVDQNGDYDDWVEVHNRSAGSRSLAGYHLSDQRGNPKLWSFPAGVSIAAAGFVRVWLDKQPTQGPLHANFKLSKAGERVFLSDPSGRVIDILEFAQQKADRSFGRLPDGAANLFYLWSPTGGARVTGAGFGVPQRFDQRRRGSPSQFELRSSSVPRIGKVLNLQLFGGPPGGSALLGLSLGVRPLDLGSAGPLLLDPSALLLVAVALDASGFGGLSGVIPTGTQGVMLYCQALATELSNGLAVRLVQ